MIVALSADLFFRQIFRACLYVTLYIHEKFWPGDEARYMYSQYQTLQQTRDGEAHSQASPSTTRNEWSSSSLLALESRPL